LQVAVEVVQRLVGVLQQLQEEVLVDIENQSVQQHLDVGVLHH
jgi:hypothetical protein